MKPPQAPSIREPNPTIKKIRQVFRACDQLTEDHGPSGWRQDDLHKVVGGSLETLVPLRKLWTAQQDYRDDAPDVASQVVMEIVQDINKRVEDLKLEATARQNDLREQYEDAYSTLCEEYEALKNKHTALVGQLSTSKSAFVEKEEEIQTIQKTCGALENALNSERNKCEKLEALVATKVKDNETLKTRLDGATTRAQLLQHNLQESQNTVASLTGRVDTMLTEHHSSLETLQRSHQAQLGEQREEGKTMVAETRAEERAERECAVAQLKENHSVELNRMEQRFLDTEVALRAQLADAQQRAATCGGQATLLERQLNDANSRIENTRNEGEVIRQQLMTAINFSLDDAGGDEAGPIFLRLWRSREWKALKAEFPGFQL